MCLWERERDWLNRDFIIFNFENWGKALFFATEPEIIRELGEGKQTRNHEDELKPTGWIETHVYLSLHVNHKLQCVSDLMENLVPFVMEQNTCGSEVEKTKEEKVEAKRTAGPMIAPRTPTGWAHRSVSDSEHELQQSLVLLHWPSKLKTTAWLFIFKSQNVAQSPCNFRTT